MSKCSHKWVTHFITKASMYDGIMDVPTTPFIPFVKICSRCFCVSYTLDRPEKAKILPEIMLRAAERRKEIVRLRDGGMKFTEIADKFGISNSRVSQLYHQGKRRERD